MSNNYVPSLPPDSPSIDAVKSWVYEELLKLRSSSDTTTTRIITILEELPDLQTLWDQITDLTTRVNNCDCAEESTEFSCILDAEGRLLLGGKGDYIKEA